MTRKRTAAPAGRLAAYRALAADRPLAASMAWSVLARLPIFLISLGLVLVAIDAGLDAGHSSLALAAYTAGGAVLAPFVARQVDRHGQTLPLLVTAVVHVSALTALVLAGLIGSPWGLLLLGLAGAAVPPVSSCVRAILGEDDLAPDLQRAGYAVEAALTQTIVVGGPLLLSLVLTVADGRAAVVGGAALAAAGAVGLASTTRSRSGPARGTTLETGRLGPLTSPGFPGLLATVFVIGAALGSYTLLVPLFTTQHGAPEAAGLLFGAWGLSRVIGGLWFGGIDIPDARVAPGYVAGLAVTVVGLGCAVVAMGLWSMAFALVVGGLLIGPTTILQYVLIQRLAAPGHRAEAFAWVLSGSVGGAAFGSLVAGQAVAAVDLRGAFAAVVVLGALAVAVAATSLRQWRRVTTPEAS